MNHANFQLVVNFIYCVKSGLLIKRNHEKFNNQIPFSRNHCTVRF